MFLILTIVLGLAFVWAFLREPRRYANAILLLGALSCGFLALATLGQGTIIEGLTLLFFFLIGPLSLFIIACVFILAGFQAIRREGFSIPQLLSIVFGLALILSEIGIYSIVVFQMNMWLRLLTFLYIFLAGYVIFSFMALWLYSLLYQIMPRRKDVDFVIIHGAGLLDGQYVTPLLAGRADKAREVFDRLTTPDKYLIASGGQGADEKISEAQAIKNYLVEQGVAENRILLEDKSTTTYENLLYSKELMDKRTSTYRAIFVTNDYHVFRTSIYARQVGLKEAEGVGCRTAAYYWPNAFIREYVAIVIHYKWVPITLTIIWAILSWISLH